MSRRRRIGADALLTSGRLTPAAATLTRTWPAPGFGVGISTGFSTSGPPGVEMATAVIVCGVLAMLLLLWTRTCGALHMPEASD